MRTFPLGYQAINIWANLLLNSFSISCKVLTISPLNNLEPHKPFICHVLYHILNTLSTCPTLPLHHRGGKMREGVNIYVQLLNNIVLWDLYTSPSSFLLATLWGFIMPFLLFRDYKTKFTVVEKKSLRSVFLFWYQTQGIFPHHLSNNS